MNGFLKRNKVKALDPHKLIKLLELHLHRCNQNQITNFMIKHLLITLRLRLVTQNLNKKLQFKSENSEMLDPHIFFPNILMVQLLAKIIGIEIQLLLGIRQMIYVHLFCNLLKNSCSFSKVLMFLQIIVSLET